MKSKRCKYTPHVVLVPRKNLNLGAQTEVQAILKIIEMQEKKSSKFFEIVNRLIVALFHLGTQS